MSGRVGRLVGPFEDVFAELPRAMGPPVSGSDREYEALTLMWAAVHEATQAVQDTAQTLMDVGDALLPEEQDLVATELMAAAARLATVHRVVQRAHFAIGWPVDHEMWRITRLRLREQEDEERLAQLATGTRPGAEREAGGPSEDPAARVRAQDPGSGPNSR
jgi:hypothetical protein